MKASSIAVRRLVIVGMGALYGLAVFGQITPSASAEAPVFFQRKATVAELEPRNKLAWLLIEPKARTANATPWRCDFYNIRDEIVFRLLPNRRKAQASYSDLRVGQHVIVSGSGGFDMYSGGSEIIILPDGAK